MENYRFRITENGKVSDRDIYGRPEKNTLWVENGDRHTTFYAEPKILKKIILNIADKIWPEWHQDESGKKTYYQYLEDCNTGTISCHNKGFVDKAWDTAYKHLKIDGVKVVIKK